jgi:hypothetical protein
VRAAVVPCDGPHQNRQHDGRIVAILVAQVDDLPAQVSVASDGIYRTAFALCARSTAHASMALRPQR